MLNVVGLSLAALPGLWLLRRSEPKKAETANDDTDNAIGDGNVPEEEVPEQHGEQQQEHAAPQRWPPGLLRGLLTAGAQCAVGVGVLYLAQAIASAIAEPERRALKAGGDAARTKTNWIASKAGGIPLAEVVRFRERQWFKDELETAKQGDTGSMVRLAKLHLAGAGCAKDLEAAKYWVRRARRCGAWVSLEELIMDGPDPPPFQPPPGFLASAARAHATS